MSSYRSGDVTLSYEEYGAGPPVVLAHGMSESTEMWRDQIDALAERHRLILWDNRGHGRSDAPDDPAQYSIPTFAADLRALLDHLGIERACIGGLSMGGYTAIAFSVTYPDRVFALILSDTASGEETIPNRPAAERAIRERLPLEALARREGMEAVALRTIVDGTASAEVIHDPARRERYIERMRQLPVNGYIWAWRCLRYRPSYTDQLVTIRAPTLCIVGECDEFLPAVRVLAERIPDAELVVIPDAGHNANSDQPKAFNRAVLTFLERTAHQGNAHSRAP